MPTELNQLPSSEEALARLMEGNRRYVAAQMEHPRRSREHRYELRNGQFPFAVVLGCADSRVSPTVIFDQGLGDLFIIRVAGNVTDTAVLASIEYAAVALKVQLIMVLGHSGCGAVQAAIADDELPGHLTDLVKAIHPAIESVKDADGDLLDNAVKANAQQVADQIRQNRPVLADLAATGQITVLPALYHLENGHVELLE